MASCSLISCACVTIVILQLLKKIVPWLYVHVIAPNFLGSKVNLQRLGEWAVVTGATDGIGKSYAKALAKKQINVVLISRSKEKLDKVAEELKSIKPIQVKTIVTDFTQGPEIYDKIEKEIAGLEIGVLVNNVGMSYEHPEFFLSIENRNQLIQNLITCNIISVTHMCGLIMPQMLERKKGVVINISSMSAVVPSPLITVYAATKAFVDKFTVDLQTEYKSKGLIVQSILPGFVATKMTKLKKGSFVAPTPDVFVSSALDTLGYTGHTTGYIVHSLMKFAIDLVKAIACEPAANSLALKAMVGIRNRALKKKAK